MKREWTPSQRDAIDAKGGSVIVSAAAGSGKTAVLVERVISRIIDPVNPVDADRILVVTFTRAAAAELKERLVNKLTELVREDPFNKALLRQQSLVNKAHISTIDGFCAAVVKEFFYILNIDRNFRIADSSELLLLKSDAMRLTLDTMYANGEPDFFRLVDAFGSAKDDALLEKVILDIHEFLLSHPYPQWWIEEKLSVFSDFESIDDSVWYSLILDYAKDAVEYMFSILDSAQKSVDTLDVLSEKITPQIEEDYNFVQRIKLALEQPQKYNIKDVLESYDFKSIPRTPGYTDHPIKVQYKENRARFKGVCDNLKKLFRFDETQCKKQIADLFVISSQLFNCVMQFTDNFQRLKAEKKIADFADLEHWTIKLLVDENTREFTDVARKLRSRFDEIMVDEYQDSNETQDLMFSAISKDGENLFFVGDVKQSIYGFRQAMPQLFLDRKNKSFTYDKNAPQFPARIFLDRNFRSIFGVTDIVNFFFTKLMSESVGDIDYNDTEKLECGAKYSEEAQPSVRYDLLEYGGIEDADKVALEAQHVAQTIAKMIGEQYMVKDGDTYRPVTYGDFAVLMRYGDAGTVFVDTLIAHGIPAYGEKSTSFINSPEITLMLNFLSIIDNPALDIELLSVMMSPIYGFTADELADIRCDCRRTGLYRAVMHKANSGNLKCIRFLKELAYFRKISVTTPVSTLINAIYERTAYPSILSALSDSDVALNNLRLLKEYARQFESSNSKGLSRFVYYLNRLKSNKGDIKASIDLSATSHNSVKVMTIHGSKGLEFPVCFIAHTHKKFVSDTTDRVLLHSKYGIALRHKDEETNIIDTTMPRQAIALAKKRDEMSEELRVLYVAMTRAKQKLIMVSSHKDVDKYLSGIGAKLSNSNAVLPYVVKSCTYLCEWLTIGAMLHPDAKQLRDIAGCDFEPDYSVKSPMEINVVRLSSEEEEEEAECCVTENISYDGDTTVIDTLLRRTSFVYKKEHLSKLPSKISASELAHKLSTKAFDRMLDTPAFMSDSKLTGAGKGTALHEFMQFCDFTLARENLEKEIERLCEKGYISQIQADSIDREKASRFINSELITRCINSSQVYKEYRFTIKVNASLVDSNLPDDTKEQIILQGAVDLAFVEGDELVIVDYKTDRVKSVDELYTIYHHQLEIYKDAMEQCTDYKVKECMIYSIHLGEHINIQ